VNKQDLALAKLQTSASKFGAVMTFAKTIANNATILGCMWIAFAGLKEITMSNPDGVHAVAELVKNLNLGSWLGYIWGGVATGGYMLERRGKKRLLKPYADQRTAREVNDPYHGSSGLNESGDSPTP
jgi:hypothetical protein